MRIGTIMHETIHSLGFGHMHAHTSRDKYITINFNNVKEGTANKNFHTYAETVRDNFGTPYDFYSIMHYGPGSENKRTIIAKSGFKKYEKYMGQRHRLSDGDVQRINNMYKCAAKYQKDAPDDYNDYFDNNDDYVTNNSEVDDSEYD